MPGTFKHLLHELDELTSNGVISAKTAEDIRKYYLSKTPPDQSSRFSTLLAILGALLVSSGIVLVIAHNWELLSKGFKTTIAILPIVLGQALCLYTLIKRKQSTGWRESAAIVLFFGVAATISLISQIFQISGTLHGFLLTWLMLTVPLVYIMKSTSVALLCISVATWYGCVLGYGSFGSGSGASVPFNYLLALAAIVPYYYWLAKTARSERSVTYINWFSAISIVCCWGAFSGGLDSAVWIFFSYLVLFDLMYLVGNSKAFRDRPLIRNPFLVIGIFGLLVVLFTWSFEAIWQGIAPGEYSISTFLVSPLFYLTMAAILCIGLLIGNGGLNKVDLKNPMVVSVIIFLVLTVAFQKNISLAVFLWNVYVILVAVFFIRKGAFEDHFGILNLGLSIIALLAVFRFFDDSIPFLWRGIFFVGTGILFFSANYFLLKKRKAAVEPNIRK